MLSEWPETAFLPDGFHELFPPSTGHFRKRRLRCPLQKPHRANKATGLFMKNGRIFPLKRRDIPHKAPRSFRLRHRQALQKSWKGRLLTRIYKDSHPEAFSKPQVSNYPKGNGTRQTKRNMLSIPHPEKQNATRRTSPATRQHSEKLISLRFSATAFPCSLNPACFTKRK